MLSSARVEFSISWFNTLLTSSVEKGTSYSSKLFEQKFSVEVFYGVF